MPKRNTTAKQKYPQPVREEVSLRRKPAPRNEAQRQYMESLRTATITFGTGPAGTGKTFLAVGVALEKLFANEVERIVITRPVVEAGEKIGYLPGTFEEKLHPYLLPIKDAIEDWVGPTKAKHLMESGKVEIAPLAFVRGRTFNECFCIADEMQNATQDQMTMLLTRIGYGTTMAINGDPSQSDIANPKNNGLAWATQRLRGRSAKIDVVNFYSNDIVRHPLIGDMLKWLDGPPPKDHLPVFTNAPYIMHRATAEG